MTNNPARRRSRASHVRPLVFWPTFLLLIAALALSIIDLQGALAVAGGVNHWILAHFSWLFSLTGVGMLLLCVWLYFSPIGQLRIGGAGAVPLLSRPRWFAVTLCTTLAVGVLFWTTAEPIYHLHSPAASWAAAPNSPAAASMAMSAMFLHWTFVPYAIYTVPAVVFALVFYNLRLPFSTGSMLKPLLGERMQGRTGQIVDAIALFALVAGMASSLGTGALAIVGGLNQLMDFPTSPSSIGLVIAAIVATFILSASSGLKKGIARLSAINAYALFFIAFFLLCCGPTTFILGFGVEALGQFLSQFFRMAMMTGAAYKDEWVGSWTIFYWAVWFAWAPISAMFLGKIARGYTVRDMVLVNLVLPSLFSIVWIGIFSGTALSIDMTQQGLLKQMLDTQGVESILYTIFRQLPLSAVMIVVLLLVAFLNYVTAADSNTDAISNLCTDGFTADGVEQRNMWQKITWGLLIGVVSWIMTSFAGGVAGVKMMSNLGGLPALLIILGSAGSLIVLARSGALLAPPVLTPAIGQKNVREYP
ncbi:BCCT family transporter [Collimonas fungivorans]|nr:BCCT family transporter [Collimonas fungivorans]